MSSTDSSPTLPTSTLSTDTGLVPASPFFELLTTPPVYARTLDEKPWPPKHVLRFIQGCDRELLTASGMELNAVVKGGDWLPFERALTKSLEPLRREISKSILSALTSVSRDSALSSIVFGGYQVHLDTMTSFWLGHPETKTNLETLVRNLVIQSPPFRDERLNSTAAEALVDSISTGNLNLPHFDYKILRPDFVTLTCHASVRMEASRRAALEEKTRGAK